MRTLQPICLFVWRHNHSLTRSTILMIIYWHFSKNFVQPSYFALTSLLYVFFLNFSWGKSYYFSGTITTQDTAAQQCAMTIDHHHIRRLYRICNSYQLKRRSLCTIIRSIFIEQPPLAQEFSFQEKQIVEFFLGIQYRVHEKKFSGFPYWFYFHT